VLEAGAVAKGGNPAGIWIGDELPSASTMQAIAADVGFSENGLRGARGRCMAGSVFFVTP
jgi:hypothetical protein